MTACLFAPLERKQPDRFPQESQQTLKLGHHETLRDSSLILYSEGHSEAAGESEAMGHSFYLDFNISNISIRITYITILS